MSRGTGLLKMLGAIRILLRWRGNHGWGLGRVLGLGWTLLLVPRGGIRAMGDELSDLGVCKSWYTVQSIELGGMKVYSCG